MHFETKVELPAAAVWKIEDSNLLSFCSKTLFTQILTIKTHKVKDLLHQQYLNQFRSYQSKHLKILRPLVKKLLKIKDHKI